jgi:hypothetical protein
MCLRPEHASLWDYFLEELRAHEDWDHDFIASPHHPEAALRAFVDAAGAAAAPTLIGALSGKDDPWNYWACVGLEWLGPLAGAAAATALEARVWTTPEKKEPYWPAAVALEAVDAARARAAGVQREPLVLGHLVRFHLARGIEAACEFIEWVIEQEDATTIEALLGNWELRAATVERCPPRLAARLRQLGQTHPGAGVRAAATNLLAEAQVVEPAAGLIETLARGNRIGTGAVERLAAHPDSDKLLDPILALRNLYFLSELLRRRRSAGWPTDPWPCRELLREKLERPTREWRYEQHDVHNAALCVAELRDLELLDSLVKAVVPENCGYAWEPLVRAFRVLGEPAHEALRREHSECPPGERRTRLEWMLARVEQAKPKAQKLLDGADEIFLRGRIEPTIWGAFRAYGEVLLACPSAHAAFQLAWIDRAFGSEVVPERVRWIRLLGFHDEELLAELATPVVRPLNGYRFEWDGGETQKHDPERAARAAEAGLPSLAAYWSREERYERAALEHLDRVWGAIAPRLMPISDCEICRRLDEEETSFVKRGREDEATHLPPEAARLLPLVEGQASIRRCPICRTVYNYQTCYEFLIGGSEDEEKLRRLTPDQARGHLTESEYEALIRWMPGNLRHPDAVTRRYAAKCLVSHHLARNEIAALRPYLADADTDVVSGALYFLWSVVYGDEKRAELWELRDVFGELGGSADERVAGYARSIMANLDRYARRAGLIE